LLACLLCGAAGSALAEETEPPQLDCAVEKLADHGPIDIAIAFNNEMLSREPSGIDVDGDGVVGEVRHSIFTDTDDSWLHLQVAAARQLVQATDDYDIRYAVITFADLPFKSRRRRATRTVTPTDARTLAAMSDDLAVIEAGLDLALSRGSTGSARFYGGVRRANEALIEGSETERESQKFAFLMTHVRGPVYLDGTRVGQDVVSTNMRIALREADRFGIRFHTFGFTEESQHWTRLPIGLIGHTSGGDYHAVVDAETLYCEMVDALVKSSVPVETEETSAGAASDDATETAPEEEPAAIAPETTAEAGAAVEEAKTEPATD